MKHRIFIFLLLLCAFALGIKSFSEPDLWWQIRTGEWILENFSIPRADPFSYTYAGTEWINIKWGFEVLAALVSTWLGPECVYLVQAIVAVFIFLFLFRWSRAFSGTTPESPVILFSLAVCFIWTAVTLEYRINGRPEMFSHLFTVLFLYQLFRYRQHPSRRIFLLILLQVAWTNLHEAYAMGIVILAIFTAGAWIEKWRTRSPRTAATRLTLTWLAAAASVAINPHGIKLWTRPLDIFGQVGENKFTFELVNATDAMYWGYQSWMAMIMGVVTVAVIVASRKRAKEFSVLKQCGPGYLMVLVAFFYLALTAQRNIVFFVLALFPLFHWSLIQFFSPRLKPAPARILAWLLPLLFYFTVVSNRYYDWTGRRTRFGLEVTTYNNPAGAAAFVEQKGLKGKTCFSDYLTSSYLLWKLQPDFRTFIDLRDLDVYPLSHFQKFIDATHSPAHFLALDSLYHFDYVVLFRPQFENLHAFLYNDSIYACTYVDAVAAVYEKTDDFTREDIFSASRKLKTSLAADAVNHILNPFYSSFNYRSVDYDRIAAMYYSVVAQPRLAQAREAAYRQKQK